MADIASDCGFLIMLERAICRFQCWLENSEIQLIWRLMLFYPLHQVFFQEHPLLAYLVGRQYFSNKFMRSQISKAEIPLSHNGHVDTFSRLILLLRK